MLRNALRKAGLPRLSKETIRVVLHEAGYRFGKTRTWCPTGTAVRKRKAGAVIVHDPKAQEKQALIELAYEQAEVGGLPLWCQDEAGPYQAIPHPGETWHSDGKPITQPHEYVRDRLAGTNGSWLESTVHSVCLEWQAAAKARTRSFASSGGKCPEELADFDHQAGFLP